MVKAKKKKRRESRGKARGGIGKSRGIHLFVVIGYEDHRYAPAGVSNMDRAN